MVMVLPRQSELFWALPVPRDAAGQIANVIYGVGGWSAKWV